LAADRAIAEEFQDDMGRICREYRVLTGKPAGRFLSMIRSDGAITTARHFLDQPADRIPTGLDDIVRFDRFDLTMEYVVLQEPYLSSSFFSPEQLDTARERLALLGYAPERSK